ncbi:SMP-30/gluconolactonase/LRE family protein [Candidatus Latescibacterota bacterium]
MFKKWFCLMVLFFVVATMGCRKELASGVNKKEIKIQADTSAVAEKSSVIAPGAKVEKLASGFRWAEGPAVDAAGNIFFTDYRNQRIFKWSLDGKLSTFLENSGGANGLVFDKDGNLLACAVNKRQIISIDPQGRITMLADKCDNKRLNETNDLWLDQKGGIYFTDPHFERGTEIEQDGEHVYYLTPNRKKVICVINDMNRPNGIICTPDNKLLYVAEYFKDETFVYTINADGTLSNKKLFAPEGSDGMTMDTQGNIYLTRRAISVYDSAGNKIETIEVPEHPANVCFGGKDKRTLFITASSSLYSLRMRVKGI